MARIRTVKPELFKHEELFEAEKESALPLRLAFIGLFTCCDREGRFKWRPRTLKLDALPYDDVDFARVLDALWTRGFIEKYEVDGEIFGFIQTFLRHQVINNRESASDLPAPDENNIKSRTLTREARVDDELATPLVQDQGEGKGREGKGKEEEGNSCAGVAPSADRPPPADKPIELLPAKPAKASAARAPAPTSAIWDAYASAYSQRYNTPPVRNAKVNGQLAQLLTRLGADEAPQVAAFYVWHNNRYYAQKMHAVDCLLADAEKLRTEWFTGRRMTAAAAGEADRLQDAGDMWARVAQRHVTTEA